MALAVLQLEVGLLQNFNELIYDDVTLTAAVVDPAFEVDRLLRVAKEHGLTIAHVLITHTHHDHIDGLEEMATATGATVYVGAGEVERARAKAPHARIVELHGGEELAIGGEVVRTIATPGHTPAGISYAGGGAVFTGDTLFIGGCGRADFAGGDPRVLWESLQRLCALPEETRVYPGHNYGKTPTSTIAWEKTSNPYLLCKNVDEFVALRMGKAAPRPQT